MPSLEGAQAWLDRAEEHLTNLRAACSVLGKAEVDAMIASIRFDLPDDGGGWAYTRPTKAIPPQASILVGESVQALRRCLDYLVYEVASLDSGAEQQDTQFPIDYSESVFDRRRQRTGPEDHRCYLIGVNDKHAAVIKALQPFRKTNGTKWTSTLGNLSNPDKHRHLTVAKSEDRNRIVGWGPATDATDHEVIRVSTDSFTFSWLLTMPNHVYMKFHITAYIALEDGLRLIETLDNLKAEVTKVIQEFAPCFGGKCQH
jgi:hypothetical protein